MLRSLPCLVLATAIASAGEAEAPLRVPLAIFGIAAGLSVEVDGAAVAAEAGGLALAPGRAVSVAWAADGRRQQYEVIVVGAATGDRTPAWAADPPRQEGDRQIVVGSGTASTLAMARQKALMDARIRAARAAGTTSVTERSSSTGGAASATDRSMQVQQSERIERGQSDAQVSGETRDAVYLVQPGAHDAARRPVTCWLRVATTIAPVQAPAAR